jgi:IS4 transposase
MWSAVLMAWDEGQTLHDRWQHAQEIACALHPHWRQGYAFSAFAEACVRWTPELFPAVTRRFQRQMEQSAGAHWRRKGWCVLAVDGSRLEAPHTLANEEELGCAGREKTGPQVFLTTLWHVGLGVPWDMRVGPGTDSERRHLDDLVAGLPNETLLLADAGFVSYGLCRRLQDAGHAFLLRVGGNITLLRELGYHTEERKGTVYLWPQNQRNQPPLVLRLITLVKGKQTIYLLTNLNRRQLADSEAAVLYAQRWGIEVFYRSYKQTLERRKLLSRTPATCLVEAQATFLGLWLLGLMTVVQQMKRRLDPQGWSVAQARNAVRQATRSVLRGISGGMRFMAELSAARIDSYARHRPKTARNYPRKKREKPPGPPKIRAATWPEKQRAQRLRKQEHVLRRTA